MWLQGSLLIVLQQTTTGHGYDLNYTLKYSCQTKVIQHLMP